MSALTVTRQLVEDRPDYIALRVLCRLGVARCLPVCRSMADALRLVGAPGAVARVSERLAPVPASIPVARWLTVRACDRWGLGGYAGPAGQVVTELVGNAVRHAGTPIDLVLSYGRPLLHIAVHDRCPRLPRQRTPEWDADGGRGLLVVEALAAAKGATPTADGKVVWAALLVRDRPPEQCALSAGSSR